MSPGPEHKKSAAHRAPKKKYIKTSKNHSVEHRGVRPKNMCSKDGSAMDYELVEGWAENEKKFKWS